MRVVRRAWVTGAGVVLSMLLATAGFAAQGRIEARARVVDTRSAREASEIAAEKPGRPVQGALFSDRVQPVQDGEVRVQLRQDDAMGVVVQVEWVDS